MLNRVVLVGRLTHDPELKRTQSDIPVVNFQVAVNRPFSRNEADQQTDFIRVVAWRRQAETLAQYVRKGALIGIDGRLQSNSYEDQTGQRRTTIEVLADSIQFLEPKSQDGNSGGYEAPQQSGYARNNDYQDRNSNRYGGENQSRYERSAQTSDARQAPPLDIEDDDLPF